MSFYNKKGVSIIVYLFYVLFGLILAVLFVSGVFMMVKGAVGDSTYHKKFYSRDLALLVDALHASNGDFIIKYDINPPRDMHLDVNLTNDKVILTDYSKTPFEKRAKTDFPFGYNDYVEVILSDISRPSTMMEFAVVVEDKTIKFRSPTEDVKLEEQSEDEI